MEGRTRFSVSLKETVFASCGGERSESERRHQDGVPGRRLWSIESDPAPSGRRQSEDPAARSGRVCGGLGTGARRQVVAVCRPPPQSRRPARGWLWCTGGAHRTERAGRVLVAGKLWIGPESPGGVPCELNARISHGTISPPRCLSLNRRGPRAPFAPAFAVLHRICRPCRSGYVRTGPRCSCSGGRAPTGRAGPALGRPSIPGCGSDHRE